MLGCFRALLLIGMKGIVIITTDSAPKREFANRLYEESGRRVDLVVVQRAPKKPFASRVLGFVNKVGSLGLPRELFFLTLWFCFPNIRKANGWIGERSENSQYAHECAPRTLAVESVNTEKVYNAIVKLSPQLIVIWGGMIVDERTLKIAPQTINMHFGWCPYYRGTNGNYHAILNNDLEHLGITVHYAVSKVDAGGILGVVSGDSKKPIPEFFRDLNDRGEAAYRSIALRLFHGEHIQSSEQDISMGKNYRLKDWTYEKRYRLGKILLAKVQNPTF